MCFPQSWTAYASGQRTYEAKSVRQKKRPKTGEKKGTKAWMMEMLITSMTPDTKM